MTRSLRTIVEQMITDHVGDLHVGMPARVESYDSSKLKATVQPLVKRVIYSESGERSTQLFPSIPDVPVIFPGTSLGVMIELPLAAGDTVWLMISSVSLDNFLIGGGISEPAHELYHDLVDAVAIPGLFDFGHAKMADTRIKITSTEIQCGGTEPCVKRSEFLDHCHATAGTGTPSGPIAGASPPGSSVVFPGTGKLRG